MRKKVYIAGPITKGDLIANIEQGCRAMNLLIGLGYAPLNPMLTCFAQGYPPSAAAGHKSEVWYDVDDPWVRASDAVLRLPGESVGADREVEIAWVMDIPVFYDIEELDCYFKRSFLADWEKEKSCS